MLRFFFGILLICSLWGCAAPKNVTEGDKLLAANEPLKAIQLYEQALQETTSESTKKSIDDKLEIAKRVYVEQLISKADQLQADSQVGKKAATDQALILLNQSRQYDTKDKLLSAKIQLLERDRQQLEIKESSTKKQIFEAIADYDFALAQKLTEQSLAISPDNKEANNLKLLTAKLASLYAELSNFVEQGDLPHAANAFNQLNDTAPIPLDTQKIPLGEKFFGLIKQQLTDLKSRNRWDEAMSLLSLLKLPEFQQEMTSVRQQGLDYYMNIVKNDLATNNPHRAFLVAEKAMTLDDKRLDMFTLHKESRDLVDKALMKYIAVGSFDSPSTDPDAGRQFSDSLISNLYNILPYGINILERDKIDVAMKEKEVGNQNLGQILGVELVITGTVSLFRVDQVVERRNASAKVQMAENVQENPAYTAMQQQYGPDEKKWPNVPQKTISEVENQMVNYTKGTGTLKGFAKVSVRIFDTNKGAISFVKDFEANVTENSDFQDEVSEAGIQYIPMKLSTETEAKEAMRKQVVDEISKIVESSFEAREQRFLDQARFFLERREIEQAMIPLAEGLIYCQKDNLPADNPSLVEIRRLINENLEI